MKPQIGDKVTCKHELPAYYSNYGGNGHLIFKPGMIGTVAAIAPKVCLVKKGNVNPRWDRVADFLVVDYQDEIGVTRRVGLDYCNAKII